MIFLRRKKRVNIALDEDLHEFWKRECEESGVSFSSVVEGQLRERRNFILRCEEKERARRVKSD